MKFFRCVAITLPLKRMEWMSVKSAKTKLIPFVLLFNLAYNSYTVFWLTKADPGILACTSHGGTSLLVSLKFISIEDSQSCDYFQKLLSF